MGYAKNILLLTLASSLLIGCKIELSEEEEADVSLAWACIYKVGKGMTCPAHAVAKVKDKVSNVANSALGTNSNQVASAIVSHSLNTAFNLSVGRAVAALDCMEVGGNGLCNLVRLANKDKIKLTTRSQRKAALRRVKLRKAPPLNPNKGDPKPLPEGKYFLEVGITVKNLADDSGSGSSSSSDSIDVY